MEQYKFKEIEDSKKDIFRQHLSKESGFYNYKRESIKQYIVSHGICRFYEKDHEYINTYGFSSKISKKYDAYEYEVFRRGGEYLYLIYIFDGWDNHMGILFTRSEFYKYCKSILNKHKDTPLWETIKSSKEIEQKEYKEDLNVTFDEIIDDIDKILENKTSTPEKSFWDIQTNIYR